MISQANIQGRLNALMQAGRAVASCADLDQALQNVVHEAAAISEAPFVRLFLLDEASHILRCRVGVGLPRGEEDGLVVPLGQSFCGEVIATGRPLAVPDTREDPRLLHPLHAMKWGMISYLGIPLTVENRPVGVLVFNTREARAYTDEEIAYLSCVAEHAALAIARARLRENEKTNAAEMEARVKGRTIELEEALRVKKEFLARMSHEFRTPLNFVLGFADLLVRETAGPLTTTQARYLNRIQMGGQHLLDLVNNLLDLTSPAISTELLRRARFPLRDILQEILDLLQPTIAAKRLTVMVAISPIFQVVADRSKLAQILRHLLENAVKFTPDGGHVSLAARELADDQSHPDLPAGRVVEISVADSGVGIAAEKLERVFGAFEQADGSTERAYEGSGLGLTLVRKRVELHGGVVWAESPGVGHGTRIIVRLPQGGMIPATKQILVVEDDNSVRRLVDVMLRGQGYRVVHAAHYRDAEKLLDKHPDVALLVVDVIMPDMTGPELASRICSRIPGLRVLYMSGYPDRDLVEDGSAFLQKPFSMQELAVKIREALREK